MTKQFLQRMLLITAPETPLRADCFGSACPLLLGRKLCYSSSSSPSSGTFSFSIAACKIKGESTLFCDTIRTFSMLCLISKAQRVLDAYDNWLIPR